MKFDLDKYMGEKLIINGKEYTFGILTDSIGDHPIWDSEIYRIFAGFDDSHVLIDIDDEEGYNVISAEYNKTVNNFEEYKAYVAQVCNTLMKDLK
jgi:hypothetical protein